MRFGGKCRDTLYVGTSAGRTGMAYEARMRVRDDDLTSFFRIRWWKAAVCRSGCMARTIGVSRLYARIVPYIPKNLSLS